MSKQVWKDLAELSAPAPGGSRRTDEFAPEVAVALAQLRASHGVSNASCQPVGNQPGNVPQALAPGERASIDALRQELSVALPGVNRRGFLQLTGAAAVFALTGCYYEDPDTLVPYAQQPEGTTLGKPVWFASVLRDSGRPVGVLVKTYDGRPIKLEGNPDHPLNNGKVAIGKLDTRTQAALLNLYDPDRQQHGPVKKAGDKTAAIAWSALDTEIGAALKGAASIGLVTGGIDGPASRALIEELRTAFGAKLRHAAYDAFANDAAIEARRRSFGDAEAKPAGYDVAKAQVLVTLGSDFLGGGETGLPEWIGFGDLRRLDGEGDKARMGQVICFEPMLTQTGTCADVRVRAPMPAMAGIGWAIAAEVAKGLGLQLPAGAAPATDAALPVIDGQPAVAYVAQQLLAAKKAGQHSLVYVGGATHCGANSLPLHLAANWLNAALGNEGVTIGTGGAAASAIVPSTAATRAALDSEVVIVCGANPAYSLPGASELLAKAKAVVVLADRIDETFAAAGTAYLAPSLHGLESWGDAEPRAGIYSLQQPCIHPLWDCRAAQESLMAFALAAGVAPASFRQDPQPGDPRALSVASRAPLWQAAAFGVQSWRNYVQVVWTGAVRTAAKVGADARGFWTAALATGVVQAAAPQKDAAPKAPAFNAGALANVPAGAAAAGGFSLVLSASRILRDGAWANNAWLQELPDPVSKVTWDNYLAMSFADGRRLGFELPRYDTPYRNPVVQLTVGGRTVSLPVHLQEGQDPGTLELFLGWGRPQAGKVAEIAGVDGLGGVNAFTLQGPDGQRWGLAAEVVPTADRYRLACTQGHNTTDGRDIVLDDVLALHRQDPGLHQREHHHTLWKTGSDGAPAGRLSMWQHTHTYPGRRWGMVVDMNTCIGCQACVVACTAENNVPVVGRDEVRKGREMHWIRIDRYFSGDSADIDRLDVETFHQPVMCQQCGHAPCEEVCPALATMHNEEGINVQVYNRCIGTRYCSNNCPYKVRRFNFYEYSKYRAGPVGADAPFGRIMKNLATDGATSSQAELTVAPLQMLLNPTVSQRSKGVMEKCNFCIQRTRDIRESEKTTKVRYDDKSRYAVKTACAQTCPTEAISFGDINDPDSVVARKGEALHGYKLLDKELNTRPSVVYLRTMRNRPPSAQEAAALAKHDAAGHDAHGAKPGAPADAKHGEDH